MTTLDKFKRAGRKLFAIGTVVASSILGAGCDKDSPINPIGGGKEPGTDPGTNPTMTVKEMVKVPIQYVEIDGDSVLTIKNNGTANAIVAQISLKKSDQGKGLPIKYKYTGQDPESMIKSKSVTSNGRIRLTAISDQAFDMLLSKDNSSNPLLNNSAVSYKNLGIEKIYNSEIMVNNETDVDAGVNKAKIFMQAGKEMGGTLLNVSGKGIQNQAVINEIVYTIK